MIFKSYDGTVLYCHSRRLKKAKASLLVVHGLGEHSGRYESFIKRVHKMGMDVHLLDLRGHGRSTGIRGHVDSFEQYYNDLEYWIKHLEGSGVLRMELPCFLLGHSLGGLISLGFIAQRKEITGVKFSGLILSAPALGIASLWAPLQYQFSQKIPRLFKSIHISNGINPSQLTHDKTVVKDYIDDPLVHSWVTPGFFQGFMDSVKSLPKLIKHIKIPTLFLLAGNDSIVSTEAAEIFAKKLSAAYPGQITIKIFHKFYHEIFNETKKDRADLILKKWINTCLNQKKKMNLNLAFSKSSKKKVTEKGILL